MGSDFIKVKAWGVKSSHCLSLFCQYCDLWPRQMENETEGRTVVLSILCKLGLFKLLTTTKLFIKLDRLDFWPFTITEWEKIIEDQTGKLNFMKWKNEKKTSIRMALKNIKNSNKSLHNSFVFYVFVFYSFFLIEMYCKVIICHSSHYMAWCTRSTTPIYRRNTRKHTQGFTMGKQEV